MIQSALNFGFLLSPFLLIFLQLIWEFVFMEEMSLFLDDRLLFVSLRLLDVYCIWLEMNTSLLCNGILLLSSLRL